MKLKNNKKNTKPRIAFAGDREIAVKVLKFILQNGVKPVALLVHGKKIASHDKELMSLCHNLDSSCVFSGDEFRSEKGIAKLKKLDLDYILSVHFHYIFPKECLEIPKYGTLNLHPAYLPYNRGWHTPSWSILDETPFGATLHFIDEGVDDGDIILQKKCDLQPEDTADSLYKKALKLELEVFKEAWSFVSAKKLNRTTQESERGTCHSKKDLKETQLINLNEKMKAGDLIRRLRALTTNDINEGAHFIADNKKYRLQIIIKEDKDNIKNHE